MQTTKLFGLVITALTISTVSTLAVYGETSLVPEWVKNNAKWWADGQIPESDFVSAMQYLINQQIISIPIASVVATDVNLDEKDRVMSVIVTYNGEIFGTPETIYTYSEFQHISNALRTTSGGISTVASETPQFYLAGLPSKDKQNVYRLVDEYVNPGRPPSTYDIQVDLVSGDGETIQTWDYRKCDMQDYIVYLDTSELNYRYGEKDDSEFREVILWECAGFSINVP